MPLKALKQTKKAENDISGILLKFSCWVPLTKTLLAHHDKTRLGDETLPMVRWNSHRGQAKRKLAKIVKPLLSVVSDCFRAF